MQYTGLIKHQPFRNIPQFPDYPYLLCIVSVLWDYFRMIDSRQDASHCVLSVCVAVNNSCEVKSLKCFLRAHIYLTHIFPLCGRGQIQKKNNYRMQCCTQVLSCNPATAVAHETYWDGLSNHQGTFYVYIFNSRFINFICLNPRVRGQI